MDMKRYALYAAVCTIISTAVLMLTDPRQLPSTALFGVFILLYINLGLLCTVFLAGIRNLLEKKWKTSIIRRVAFSFALLPIFLLLLQSVGQLTPRDVFLASAFVVLVWMYVHRMLRAAPASEQL